VFGQVPLVARTTDPAAFVQQNFRNASSDRRLEAAGQINNQRQEKQDELRQLSAKAQEIFSTLSSDGQRLSQEIGTLQKAFEEARKNAMELAEFQAQTLQNQVAAKDSDIAAKDRAFDQASKTGADPAELGRLRDEKRTLEMEKQELLTQAAQTRTSVVDNPNVVEARWRLDEKVNEFETKFENKEGLGKDEADNVDALRVEMARAREEAEKLKRVLEELRGIPKGART